MGKLIVIGTLVALFVGSLGLYGFVNEVRNTGIGHEKQLTAQYLDNQNYLSAYVSGFYEQLGVANLKSERLDTILLNAVKGRYDDGGFSVGSSFFTAIVESYPNLTVLNVYDKVVDYIAAGREGYRNMQSKLLDQLRSYDTWRETDIVRNFVAESILGFPGNNLEARIGQNVFTGPAARDKMYQIVLTPDVISAYETSRMEPLKVPGSSGNK